MTGLVGYGGGTVCRRNLAALERWGWGVVLTPFNVRRLPIRFMFDNGAWTDYVHKRPFSPERFHRAVHVLRDERERRPDFAVCPDLVARGLESLRFSISWRRDLPGDWPWYLAVQDGMAVADVEPELGPFGGVFVGGTSEWKLRTLPGWAALARRAGKALHVGRVNSLSRAFYAARVCGADSFDGTNWQRTWAGPQIERVARSAQLPLALYGPEVAR